MNLRWVVVPAVFAAAACATGDKDGNASRSSSRAEAADAAVPDGGAAPIAASCVRAIDLGMNEGQQSRVVAINGRGEALIHEEIADLNAPGGFRYRAYYWSGTTRSEITGFDGNVYARDLNESGDIVVSAGPYLGPRKGYLLRDGSATELGTLAPLTTTSRLRPSSTRRVRSSATRI